VNHANLGGFSGDLRALKAFFLMGASKALRLRNDFDLGVNSCGDFSDGHYCYS
jgi:hypothetical protein